MLRPVRTVRVTTKEELDAALATADQVTVEGDDELLSYAVNKAAGDPDNRVIVTVEGDRAVAVGGKITGTIVTGEGTAVPRPKTEARATPPAAVRAQRVILITAAVLAAVVVIGAAIWLLAGRSAPPASNYPGIGTGGGGGPSPVANDFWANLPSLLWPLVAVVAIIALFLIARQAISSGSNVTIVWKVTEKVQGRVVITKLRERTPRSVKAA